MCVAPSMPSAGGNTFWSSGAPGMTPEETEALPGLTSELLAWGGIGGVAERGQERTAALEKWKADNPERYQEALRAQEQAASGEQPRTQSAQSARQGAGGSGGGGASSLNTLLTSGTTQGVAAGDLDLSKSTLLGL